MFSCSSVLSWSSRNSDENGWIEYSANVNITTAIAAGRRTTTKTHEQINAGKGPQKGCNFEKLSNKKAYSPPLLGTTVPNSAKHKAPKMKVRNSLKIGNKDLFEPTHQWDNTTGCPYN